MTRFIIIAIALSACTANDNGQPVVEMAPGYYATICETTVGLTGTKKGGGVAVTTKWGCGHGE